MYRIGIDVGGTFTDFVAVSDSGKVTIAKSPSTPDDQSKGVVAGLGVLAEDIGMELAQLLEQTSLIVHGSTVATNALLELKGARSGMLTTQGHRDVVEMREGLKPDRYRYRMTAPEPLIPRARRLGVCERIRVDGSVEIALDEAQLRGAIEQLIAQGVEAVAVCYLHSYLNDAHEQRTGEILKEMMPGAYVSLSSEVLPQIKEYERFCTTMVNAYIGPPMENYLRNLKGRLQEIGYSEEVLIMHSHGGVASIADTIKLAAGCVLSGPAGGIAGARYAARLMGEGNLVTFDMGGTSTDISLLQDGEPPLSSDNAIGDSKIALPSIAIHTVGAGGGSIAHVDAGGILRVGPESAGAVPGPAAYGRGGTEPATTDANVVLGYLDPDNFLGGRASLDVGAARKAVSKVAEPLGMSIEDAAQGIQRVVNTTMAEAIRLVSVRRGIDPRKSALLSFGGAAGLHVTAVARELGIEHIIVPRVASVLSAWGMLASDLRYELVKTFAQTDDDPAQTVRGLFREMEQDGVGRLRENFDGDIQTSYFADMRYGEQVFEIQVPLEAIDIDDQDLIEQMEKSFHRRHEELYTYSSPDQEVVIVNLRVAVVGKLPALPQETGTLVGAQARPVKTKQVYLDGWLEVPVYEMDELAPGQQLAGPTLVISPTTAILLREREAATVTAQGWLDISLGTEPASGTIQHKQSASG